VPYRCHLVGSRRRGWSRRRRVDSTHVWRTRVYPLCAVRWAVPDRRALCGPVDGSRSTESGSTGM